MAFKLATDASDDLLSLWGDAVRVAGTKRGGPELVATIRGDTAVDQMVGHLVDQRGLWLATRGTATVGFVVYRDRVIEALYVDPHHRRRGVARSMVNALRELEQPPVDALALPGDRATKSLYESFGWKARLLTMHAE